MHYLLFTGSDEYNRVLPLNHSSFKDLYVDTLNPEVVLDKTFFLLYSLRAAILQVDQF